MTRFLIFFFASILFLSCTTDKSRKAKSEETVNNFISNLNLDNYEILYKNYPDFQKIKNYIKIKDFKLTSTILNEDQSVSIICTTKSGNIMFVVNYVDGIYIISKTKGLASVFYQPLYKFCKKIGCIQPNDYDTDISLKCFEKQVEFNSIIANCKNEIEANFIILNNNLLIDYNYVSGNITVKNGSRFSINGGNYDIYYHFLNRNGKTVFTKKDMLNYESIPYSQSVTKSIYEANASGFHKIKIELKILSTNFIENIIAENVNGNNCRVTLPF